MRAGGICWERSRSQSHQGRGYLLGAGTTHIRGEGIYLPLEEVGVADEAVLDHLGDAGGQLAVGQCGERLRVDHHAPRL
eukprot:6305887-Pyramimonas_sp.AAC.1